MLTPSYVDGGTVCFESCSTVMSRQRDFRGRLVAGYASIAG
jgi:hypothetical protein